MKQVIKCGLETQLMIMHSGNYPQKKRKWMKGFKNETEMNRCLSTLNEEVIKK
jgi:hypothetical protein